MAPGAFWPACQDIPGAEAAVAMFCAYLLGEEPPGLTIFQVTSSSGLSCYTQRSAALGPWALGATGPSACPTRLPSWAWLGPEALETI